MSGTGLGTSLILLAVGAVLALAIDYQVSSVDINAIGIILMVVGIIGLVLSLMFLGGAGWFGSAPPAGNGHNQDGSVETHTTREVLREADRPGTETTTTRTTRRI